MTFAESVSTCFKKYFVIKGRASKSEFWWFQLLWSASIFIMFIFEGSEPVIYFFIGIIVVIFIPLFTVGVRRLHDTGKSGFNYFWSLVPFIGSLVAGNRSAYSYLPQSVDIFPDADLLSRIMEESGMVDVRYQLVGFGTVAIHQGTKPHV